MLIKITINTTESRSMSSFLFQSPIELVDIAPRNHVPDESDSHIDTGYAVCSL